MGKLNLSPSVCHRYIMDRTKQELAYRGGNVKKWQTKLRRKLKELVGDFPEKRVPLNVRSIWKKKHKLGTIEKIAFTSEPYADVPAYVCLPKGVEPPYTFFVCVQGHSTGMHNSIAIDQETETKKINVPGDRDFAHLDYP